ncbi:MAG: ferredoxin--NADP reductase [Cyclobacteriaceae bacterium]
MLFKIFKKNQEENHSNAKILTLRVRETVQETPDTVSIYFEQPEPFLDYLPGQFLSVILVINGKEERRSYSLCTSPFMDPFPGITVKRLKGGLVSNHINDYFRPGKKVSIMKPMGNFVTDFHSKNKRNYGMIAGGSGITPILSNLKSVLINEPLSKVNLLYCSRTEEMTIFSDILAGLEEKYPGRLSVTHNLTQPGSDWKGLTGRLDKPKIAAYYKERFSDPSFESMFFVCGPVGLMDTAEDTLASFGVPKEIILIEQFFKELPLDEGNEDAPEIIRPVTIILEGQEFTFDVPPGKTILEAGLDEDLDMPYSCQSGLCTACRGKLLSGKVKMLEEAGLTDEEINEGYILCCSSKPEGSDIKIQIE